VSSILKLHLRDGLGWNTVGNACARGAAYLDGKLCDARQLTEHLDAASSADQFKNIVAQCNGFFAAVKWHGDAVYASVDHARSMPLFYAICQDNLYLSDDAHTLDGRIRQLQAGEMLSAIQVNGRTELRTARWFQYLHRLSDEWSEAELAQRHDAAVEAAFNRLVQYADGRLIAVPLSAGYDSRLILLMLKRLGYENVLAFSYGRPGNAESRASQPTAQRLGFNWEFVPYSEKRWREWFISADRVAYFALAENLSSLPVLQDWPAIGELKRSGVLTNDAIIVPGYSADAFPGSRKRAADSPVYQSTTLDRATVISANLDYTHFLWDWPKQQPELRPMLEGRIDQAMGPLGDYDNSACAIEAWGIQERQAKFITNAVRAYEFWGLNWWLPLWDREFTDYWMKVPFKHRIRRVFSRTQILRLESEVTGIPMQPPRLYQQSAFQRLATWLRSLGMHFPILTTIYNYFRARAKYATHPMAWHGMIPRRLFCQRFRGRVNINSFLALYRLGWISFDDE
jgi:asparagine synthase (glutamine-hydrolysing)